MSKKKSEPKEFSLKPLQQQLLNTEMQMYQSKLSNLLSFFAIENWAYPVDENTKYTLGENFETVTIEQAEPEQPTTLES